MIASVHAMQGLLTPDLLVLQTAQRNEAQEQRGQVPLNSKKRRRPPLIMNY